MSALQTTIDLSELGIQVLAWLDSRVSRDAVTWLREKSDRLREGAEDWEVFSSFSAAPRHTGKNPLRLSTSEQHRAEAIRSGWRPDTWSTDELGRTLLVIAIAERGETEFLEKLANLLSSSDVGESLALYRSLPVLPHPEQLTGWAAEGIRSNMTSVFNAVALNSPYPADFLSEEAWNQVLKALFIGSPLHAIQGIDRRANRTLARMLVEYAHERWAAGRSVSPALWRPVGPHAEGDILKDIEKVLTRDDPIQQMAAGLALSQSPSPEAKALLNQHPDITTLIKQSDSNWDSLEKQASEG